MGTLASQPEIGVWVREDGTLVGARRYYPRKKFEIVYAKSCNLMHLLAFLNTVTMRTPSPHVPLEMTPE